MSSLPEGIRRWGKGFQVDVQEGGVRRRVTVPTLEEAVKLRTLLRAELYASNESKRTKTLKDAYDQALIEQWSKSKSAHSQKVTLLNAAVVLKFFGPDTAIAGITRSDVTAFEEHLRKERGVADSTINRYHAPLSTMLTIAYEHGWITKRPVIKHHRESHGRVRWLSDEEEAAMLGAFEQWGCGDHWDAMVMLVDTGMRNGELWELSVKDCNLAWANPQTGARRGGMVHIWRNKTDLPRSLPLTQRAYDVLTRRASTGTLFPYHNRWFQRMWDRAKAAVGIHDPTLIPYCCRHTCATRLLQRGMTLPELQAWLGHKNIQMTMRYAHLSPTALVKGATLLEQKGVVNDHNSTRGTRHTDRRVAGVGHILDDGEVEPESLPSGVRITYPHQHGGVE
jgi:integrase